MVENYFQCPKRFDAWTLKYLSLIHLSYADDKTSYLSDEEIEEKRQSLEEASKVLFK